MTKLKALTIAIEDLTLAGYTEEDRLLRCLKIEEKLLKLQESNPGIEETIKKMKSKPSIKYNQLMDDKQNSSEPRQVHG